LTNRKKPLYKYALFFSFLFYGKHWLLFHIFFLYYLLALWSWRFYSPKRKRRGREKNTHTRTKD